MATKTKTAGEAQTPEAGIVSAGAEQAAEQTAPGREANQAEEAREQTSPASVETPETSADREKEAEAPALEQLSVLADICVLEVKYDAYLPTIVSMAEAEGLDAHARAVTIRLKGGVR